jgi:formylglycine-generating enzyme required for sulfatase activity
VFQVGDTIGPYVLNRKLGKGGFGEVWLAEEKDVIMSSPFAIKILFDDDADVETVKQEALVWLQACGHPNVLPIHKAAKYDEHLVIVSEYAPDGSLREWLNRYGGKAPSFSEAMRMTYGVLGGLAHLHKRDVIHRDIKPDNVLMQGVTPLLSDFGISRVVRSSAHTHTIAGTPSYMAPEAFIGGRDVQTDIWSVGVMLYEMVSGQMPFAANNVWSLKYQVINNEPQSLAEDVPELLRETIVTALQKDPTKRFKTALEMRESLKAVARAMEQEGGKPSYLTKESPVFGRPSFMTSVASLKKEAARSFNLGNYNEAISKWRDVLRLEPSQSAVMDYILEAEGKLRQETDKKLRLRLHKESVNGVEIEMIEVEEGRFLMGAPEGKGREDERPQHLVRLPSFFIGKYPVTQAEWRAVADLPKEQRDLEPNPSHFKGDSLPVEQISWEEAVEFCERLSKATGKNYRLPTEAEWEYACRAGTIGAYAGDLNEMAWYSGNADDQTHPVGSKKPNRWGLYDMQGNVWEWCQDIYAEDYYRESPPESPPGAELSATNFKRVIRGGSHTCNPFSCRSSVRFKIAQIIRYYDVGFRLARSE